jgi:hypothetical protein
MTAEIFAAMVVASLMSSAIQIAVYITVWRPVMRWWIDRHPPQCVLQGCGGARADQSMFCTKHSPVPYMGSAPVSISELSTAPGSESTNPWIIPLRSQPIWLRRYQDRLHVLVERPASPRQWELAIDVSWPGGDCEISHIWEGWHVTPDPLSTARRDSV